MDTIPEPQKYPCPCCGYLTFTEEDAYDICPVCYWEDDPYQRRDPDESEGANKVSLNEARSNFIQFGACTEKMVPFVREPFEEEFT